MFACQPKLWASYLRCLPVSSCHASQSTFGFEISGAPIGIVEFCATFIEQKQSLPCNVLELIPLENRLILRYQPFSFINGSFCCFFLKLAHLACCTPACLLVINTSQCFWCWCAALFWTMCWITSTCISQQTSSAKFTPWAVLGFCSPCILYYPTSFLWAMLIRGSFFCL